MKIRPKECMTKEAIRVTGLNRGEVRSMCYKYGYEADYHLYSDIMYVKTLDDIALAQLTLSEHDWLLFNEETREFTVLKDKDVTKDYCLVDGSVIYPLRPADFNSWAKV